MRLFFITLLLICFCIQTIAAKTVHHYVFFAHERERISEASFLGTKAFEGAQLKYTWKELEQQKDQYDFSAIRKDLAFLTTNGKRLFIQLQDASFSEKFILVPKYLQTDDYNGGWRLNTRLKITMKLTLELQAGYHDVGIHWSRKDFINS